MDPVGILIRLAIIAAFAGALYGIYRGVDSALEHHYADPVRKEFADYKAAQAERTRTVLAAQVSATKENEDAADRRKNNLDRDFSVLALRARGGSGGSCVRPAASARLLDDAVRAANADRPAALPADGGGKAGADTIPGPAGATGDVVYDIVDDDTWKVAAAHAYRDAFDLWLACRGREDSLRVTVNKLLGGTP